MNRRLIAALGLALGFGSLAPLAIAANDPASTPFSDPERPSTVDFSPLPPDTVQNGQEAPSLPMGEVQAAPAPSAGEVYAAPALPSQADVYGVPRAESGADVGPSTVMSGDSVRPHQAAVEEDGHLILTFPDPRASSMPS